LRIKHRKRMAQTNSLFQTVFELKCGTYMRKSLAIDTGALY